MVRIKCNANLNYLIFYFNLNLTNLIHLCFLICQILKKKLKKMKTDLELVRTGLGWPLIAQGSKPWKV